MMQILMQVISRIGAGHLLVSSLLFSQPRCPAETEKIFQVNLNNSFHKQIIQTLYESIHPNILWIQKCKLDLNPQADPKITWIQTSGGFTPVQQFVEILPGSKSFHLQKKIEEIRLCNFNWQNVNCALSEILNVNFAFLEVWGAAGGVKWGGHFARHRCHRWPLQGKTDNIT